MFHAFYIIRYLNYLIHNIFYGLYIYIMALNFNGANSEDFKMKYLKYKTKYLELKKLQGGWTVDDLPFAKLFQASKDMTVRHTNSAVETTARIVFGVLFTIAFGAAALVENIVSVPTFVGLAIATAPVVMITNGLGLTNFYKGGALFSISSEAEKKIVALFEKNKNLDFRSAYLEVTNNLPEELKKDMKESERAIACMNTEVNKIKKLTCDKQKGGGVDKIADVTCNEQEIAAIFGNLNRNIDGCNIYAQKALLERMITKYNEISNNINIISRTIQRQFMKTYANNKEAMVFIKDLMEGFTDEKGVKVPGLLLQRLSIVENK